MANNTVLKQDFPLAFVLYWLVLPNLAFMLMWAVGGPPMVPLFLQCGLASLVIAQLPWVWFKRTALAAMAVYSTYYYICVMFNIGPYKFDFLWSFITEVRPMRSPEYLIAAVVLIVTIGIALRKAPYVQRFSSPMSYLLAMIVLMAMMAADHAATFATRGSYRGAPAPGTEFASGVQQAGIATPSAESRNLVLVVVEALGVPAMELDRRIFDADWNRPHWRNRYDVTSGTVPFYGSTTRGEMRELCDRWQDYGQVAEFAAECLPSRYRNAGYETHAFHGFDGSLFSRQEWYPQIGFDNSTFRTDLMQAGLSHCVGVFAGACDRQIPPLIAERLKRATRPQLIYFLTLNTHLPIVANDGLGTANCNLGNQAWAAENQEVCRLYQLQHLLADALDKVAMDEDLPPTDFLIVGDHLPPFFNRADRARFDPASVPWILLRYRGARTGNSANTEFASGQPPHLEPVG